MFEYKSMEIPMKKRKWFIDKNGGLSDLDQFDRFLIAFSKEKDKFAVCSDFDDETEWAFGWFDSKDEAKEYVKEIYNFLIAE